MWNGECFSLKFKGEERTTTNNNKILRARSHCFGLADFLYSLASVLRNFHHFSVSKRTAFREPWIRLCNSADDHAVFDGMFNSCLLQAVLCHWVKWFNPTLTQWKSRHPVSVGESPLGWFVWPLSLFPLSRMTRPMGLLWESGRKLC